MQKNLYWHLQIVTLNVPQNIHYFTVKERHSDAYHQICKLN